MSPPRSIAGLLQVTPDARNIFEGTQQEKPAAFIMMGYLPPKASYVKNIS